MSTNECFQRQLAKANDETILAALENYYTTTLGHDLLWRPGYRSDSDQFLQQIGCDVLLGDEKGAYFTEEKIWIGGNQFFFPEFKTNGKPGWAVDFRKRTEYIFCVTSTDIYTFHFYYFRQVCIDKQANWEQAGYMRTNDNNIYAQIPIEQFLADFEAAGHVYGVTPLGGYLQ